MRNNSIAIFHIDGVPILRASLREGGACLTVQDSQDPVFGAGVDLYVPSATSDRLLRAVFAFNEIMREPIENREAAE